MALENIYVKIIHTGCSSKEWKCKSGERLEIAETFILFLFFLSNREAQKASAWGEKLGVSCGYGSSHWDSKGSFAVK